VRGTRFCLRVRAINGVFDSAMQRYLQPQKLVRAGGAEINRGLRAFGDRVHAGAAVNRAQIQRSPRLVRHLGLGQHSQRRGQGGNGVRRSRIGKAVSARPGHSDAVATAAQGLRHGRVRPRPVQDNMRGDAARQHALVEVAHAAQVAFALLAHIPKENQWHGQLDLCLYQRMGDGQHSHQSSAIVASAGSLQAVAVHRRLQGSPSREDRVQMRRKHDDRASALHGQPGCGQPSEDIPNCIRFHRAETGLGKTCRQPPGPRLLSKGRRRDSHQLRLPVHDRLGIAAQPGKGQVNRPLRS